jgi:hypothetical protein
LWGVGFALFGFINGHSNNDFIVIVFDWVNLIGGVANLIIGYNKYTQIKESQLLAKLVADSKTTHY